MRWLTCTLLVNTLILITKTGAIAQIDPVHRLLTSISIGTRRPDLVLYTRVPKTGSSSFQRHLDALASKLNYTAFHFSTPPWIYCSSGFTPCRRKDRPFLPYELDRHRKRILAMANGTHAVVDFHFAYLRFVANTAPIHINIVREPISRLISHYNYMRFGSERKSENRRDYIREYGALSIQECIDLYFTCQCVGDCRSEQSSTCTQGRCLDLYSGFNSQMMYFCPVGTAVCADKNASALVEALRMLHEYEAVGITESPQESMRLFEAVLPRYFKGLSELEQKHVRQSSTKAELSKQLLDQLMDLNSLDVQFYEHAVKLLSERLQAAEASPWRQQLQGLMNPQYR
ncbi:hypothetical protein CEUSTIGMA_g10559.t1 [Chlamydomonas eustigma]|uniref:Sulfotransferase n=1 Tax=Chlamydomonas eustigma TaxID=1157962 RepID=A0A250XJC0_9CHLO|nr:hypothetical protein CEUSTIGMA_g10559.t1 [Chlamydomonas eustigma]|eukprot:GAX83133.1 hypothetical protein CEUSTIGMA_g10559.t1 [Chlamydomonas eustigma]